MSATRWLGLATVLALAATPFAFGKSPAFARLHDCLKQFNVRCAEAALAQIGAPREDDAEYLYLDSELLLLERRAGVALGLIQRAIRISPGDERYFIAQGRIYQSLGNQAAAIRSFLTAERLRPGSEAPVYYIGMSLFLLGNYYNETSYYERAARNFRTALHLDPHAEKSEFMLGVIDAIALRLGQARREFETAERMSPNNPYYHLYDGIVLSRIGDDKDALREIESAERLDPADARTRLNLGNLYARMGKYEEARRQLEAAVRIDPHLSGAYYTLGRVDARLGLHGKSRQAFQEFQDLESKPQRSQNENPVVGAIGFIPGSGSPRGRETTGGK